MYQSHPKRIHHKIAHAIRRPAIYRMLILLNIGFLSYHVSAFYQVYGRPPSSGYKPMETVETPGILSYGPDGNGNMVLEAQNQFRSEKHYRLTLPSSCNANSEPAIRCIHDGGEFSIYPYGWSRTVDVLRRDAVLLGNRKWNRVLYQTPEGSAASYGIDVSGVYYLFEIRYAPYTQSAETKAERIVSSLQVIEP